MPWGMLHGLRASMDLHPFHPLGSREASHEHLERLILLRGGTVMKGLAIRPGMRWRAPSPPATLRAPMTHLDAGLAARARDIVSAAYTRYVDGFRYLTHLARGNFERRDWADTQRISALRLDSYSEQVSEARAALTELLGARAADRDLWARVREACAEEIRTREDAELAETFFNSVARRLFGTVGVDAGIEFVTPVGAPRAWGPPWSVTVRFERTGTLDELFGRVLQHFRFDVPWHDLEADARGIAAMVRQEIADARIRGVELMRSPAFRGKGAYLVGKVHTTDSAVPLVLALVNPLGRISVDSVLITEDEVSIVFSFARSYFFIDLTRPREVVEFLRSIMPRKPVSELYNAIGFNRHGKTELYRSLFRHLESGDDRFEIAPGKRGMVMCVFVLPGFDVAFKVIRDRFEYPKTVTHQEVRDKYRLVFRHDRAGRLVDAQEFEQLEFERRRFTEPLLEMLTTLAAESVTVEGERVVIRHVYTERRLRPLDLYLAEAAPVAAREAVLEYGQALRDLAATNIFPGDLLLKNFGVSRHGRLIFYDYDELCRLTDCNFRVLPRARTGEEETSEEPWFYVGERDIFPEEFRSFLGLTGDLLESFLAVHGELLDVAYWRRMQELHQRGEVLDVFPYKAARRLKPRARSGLGR